MTYVVGLYKSDIGMIPKEIWDDGFYMQICAVPGSCHGSICGTPCNTLLSHYGSLSYRLDAACPEISLFPSSNLFGLNPKKDFELSMTPNDYSAYAKRYYFKNKMIQLG